ncbi:MAG: RecQ family ATP-dependent DNA helicase [Salibacteraceae bacterium]|nr:RecQ family ATP-dependent DNA helicase [Salibacteraceae bacterium]MDP4964212.1 RecQ family ATP-dependent DNA helicase [Salibacteraceae bacterium]
MNATDVLKQYWGFDAFRPLQEDIVNYVVSGKDALALLPTGGGKSICFQVPAMMMDGICIVVSPLIALMKDQVDNLKKRGIAAMCITSDYGHREIDNMFDRCIYDKIKFLYLSPERLLTDMAKMRIAKMKVNLIAVDEAHCISEWGYDFRPPYLQIAEIRALHPKVPILALTASATPTVVNDIQEKLAFKKKKVFAKSFKRDNLAYFVVWDENKIQKAAQIIQKRNGSGIIYMRSRKGTERIARELNKLGISADYYHAGLESEIRSEKQNQWINNRSQVIVATNAFGMGIDKPDVRFVIHMDLPDTLENYYQECGRGGRDGNKAFAVSVLAKKDVERLRSKLIDAFPEKVEIKQAYAALGSYLQLAVGSGKDETYDINIELLAERFNLNARKVFQSLKFLEKEGLIAVNEIADRFSTVKIVCDHQVFYNYQINNPKLDPLLNGLMRSYGRLFEEQVAISEWTIAKRARWPKDKVVKGLQYLQKLEMIEYKEASALPKVTFTLERLDQKNFRISDEHYALRKQIITEKVEAMIHYAESTEKCRSRMILEYFGETDAQNCGMCDWCMKKKKEP